MSKKNSRAVVTRPIRSAEGTSVNRKLVTRWGGHDELFASPEGWVGVPDAFLRNYANLQSYGGLTVGEAMFVLQLMAFKWTGEDPFPSYKTLARRMGVTDKMVRRYAAKLEGKGYLKRRAQIGGTNTFDLKPLFAAVRKALELERKAAA